MGLKAGDDVLKTGTGTLVLRGLSTTASMHSRAVALASSTVGPTETADLLRFLRMGGLSTATMSF